jgi:MYXO-CTERM domain-containing protein
MENQVEVREAVAESVPADEHVEHDARGAAGACVLGRASNGPPGLMTLIVLAALARRLRRSIRPVA